MRCGSDKHKVDDCTSTMKLVLIPINDTKTADKDGKEAEAAMAEEVECELSAEESFTAAESAFTAAAPWEESSWAPAEEFIDRAAVVEAVCGEKLKEVSFLAGPNQAAAAQVESEGGGDTNGDSVARKTAAR